MKHRHLLASLSRPGIFAAAACFLLAGCGGSSGTSGNNVPFVSRYATAPKADPALGIPAFGYDEGGKPVYAERDGTSKKWTVCKSAAEPVYSLDLAGITAAVPVAITGKYVSGRYEDGAAGGTLVAFRKPDTSVSIAKYPGFFMNYAEGDRLIVTRHSDGMRFSLDLASGSLTAIVPPDGYEMTAVCGKWVLCRSDDSFVLLDNESKATVPLQLPKDSTSIYAESVSADGQVFGQCRTAAGGVEVRLWSKAGVPGTALDAPSTPPAKIEGCAISKDGTRMTWSKTSGAAASAMMRYRGTNYNLRTDALGTAQLGHLNDSGTFGLAQAAGDLGATEWFTAKIDYVKP